MGFKFSFFFICNFAGKIYILNYIICLLLLGMFDRDQSGTINFNEFCNLWNYITQWKGAFDRYDTDRSGSIEAHELHRVFSEMGYRVSPNFIQLIVVK